MPKIRQLFNDVEIEVAKARRACYHNRAKHSIAKGERCLVIKNPGGMGSKNYCIKCATDILNIAVDDLAALRSKLTD